MKIVTVIPLTKGIFKEHLTYFTSINLTCGALVSVPVRGNEIDALVVEVKDAHDLKISLKTSDFSLKKITSIKHETFFTPAFIRACQKSADYFLVPLGHVIKEFTSKTILEKETSTGKKNKIKATDFSPATTEPKMVSEKYALQDDWAERLNSYRRTIRESFAKKQSICIVFPTAVDIEESWPELSRGIEDHTVVLHNRLSSKYSIEIWDQALENPKPILLLTTPLFLSLPRTDIKTFIIDSERSSIYKNPRRPYLDARVFIELLADSVNGKLILGDTILRAETIERINRRECIPVTPLRHHLKGQAESLVVGPTINPSTQTKNKNVPVLSEELLSMIEYSLKNSNRILLISDHRGLSSVTICSDCSKVVMCDVCGTAVVLHHSDEGPIFMCHKCGALKKAEDTCTVCGGWRLALLGSGVDKIYDEVGKHFPGSQIFRIDSDSTPTPKKALEEAKKFMTTKPAIMIGTEMALRYVKQPVEYSAITSIDSLFSIPDFRINEKIVGLIIETHKRATKHSIIQTKQPDNPIFEYCLSGNILEFFRTELAERKLLHYPPFGRLIKITTSGPKQTILEALKKLISSLKDYQPLVIPNLDSPAKDYTVSIILKLPVGHLDPTLENMLRALPPSWLVDVDPEAIL